MKISAKSIALSFLVLGVFCVVFGIYLFEEYSPLSHSVSDPSVILWYPIGLALMLGGVACVVAALLEVEMSNLRRKVDELHGRTGLLTEKMDELYEKTGQLTGKVDELYEKTGQLTGKVDQLTGKVGTFTETVEGLGGKSDKLTKKTDELTTKVGKLTTTTKAEFKKLSTILKKRKRARSTE